MVFKSEPTALRPLTVTAGAETVPVAVKEPVDSEPADMVLEVLMAPDVLMDAAVMDPENEPEPAISVPVLTLLAIVAAPVVVTLETKMASALMLLVA